MVADNKLEEIVDLLAEYGGFNREYLRDKLLTSSKEEVAHMFGKELGEEFTLRYDEYIVKAEFNFEGLSITTKNIPAIHANWLHHYVDK